MEASTSTNSNTMISLDQLLEKKKIILQVCIYIKTVDNYKYSSVNQINKKVNSMSVKSKVVLERISNLCDVY